jgi:parallel beta-helix repeat protein
MKRLFLILFLSITFSVIAKSNSYYISNSGSDNNNGLTAINPFKSLGKMNSIILYAGDKVFLHRGDTFPGELVIRQSGSSVAPIIIDAYGNGNKPVISGGYILRNWKKYKGNIWQAAYPPQYGDTITNLVDGSKILPLGRYPNRDSQNKGFIIIASHTGKSTLVSSVNLQGVWVGAEVVYYPQQWILERCKILAQDHNTLTLDGKSDYDIQDKWGFFIENSLNTLDEDGEWYYDAASKNLFLYSFQDPNIRSISATAYNNGISLIKSNNIIVRNIGIDNTKRNGVYAHNSSYVTLKNLDIQFTGERGIFMDGSGTDPIIENTTIQNTNDNGVEITGYNNLQFRSNTLKNIAINIGMGKGRDGHYFGLYYVNPAPEGHSVIENDLFFNIGYAAIRFESSNIYIQHNYIDHFNLVKGDGGGIYTHNFQGKKPKPYINQHIIANIITNGSFTGEGTFFKLNESNAHGIYMDWASTNVEIRDNTISNCSSSGIYVLAANHITITGNTCYNNGAALFILDNQPTLPVHDIIAQNNIFYAKTSQQVIEKITVLQQDKLSGLGNISNNIYSDLSAGQRAISINANHNRYQLSMGDWQSKFNNDQSSKLIPRPQNENDTQLYLNPSNSTKVIPINGQYKDVKNNVYNGSITLAPYSSVLLMK